VCEDKGRSKAGGKHCGYHTPTTNYPVGTNLASALVVGACGSQIERHLERGTRTTAPSAGALAIALSRDEVEGRVRGCGPR
jgi:hypothetical protein